MLSAELPNNAVCMRIDFAEGASLWKEASSHQPRIIVQKRSVAITGIIEIARALARKAAREDHAQAMAGRN